MDDQNLIRINKFLSEVGFCSRRAADTLVEEGRVTANGVVCVMGSKVTRNDEIRVNGKLVSAPKEKHVYIAEITCFSLFLSQRIPAIRMRRGQAGFVSPAFHAIHLHFVA